MTLRDELIALCERHGIVMVYINYIKDVPGEKQSVVSEGELLSAIVGDENYDKHKEQFAIDMRDRFWKFLEDSGIVEPGTLTNVDTEDRTRPSMN